MPDELPPSPSWTPPSLLDERLFRARTVQLFGEVNDRVAAAVTRQLLALDAESDAPIAMFVSSPGGHVESGDAIHDVVRFIAAPVTMIGSGWVGSIATHLYLAVPRERRVCLPNTRFLIHSPAGGAGGPATDMAIHARQIVRTRERIARVIADATGQPVERVLADTDRDFWLDTEEAIAYGIVSRVIAKRADLAIGDGR